MPGPVRDRGLHHVSGALKRLSELAAGLVGLTTVGPALACEVTGEAPTGRRRLWRLGTGLIASVFTTGSRRAGHHS